MGTNPIISKLYNIKSITVLFLLIYYEPFGLVRFATDHSLTKITSRHLFVRIRHYTTPLTAVSRPYPLKNPKLQLCRHHVPLEALYLVVGGLIVPPKGNAVCTAAILDFL